MIHIHTLDICILTGRNLRNNTEHSFPLPKINHPVLTADSEVHSNVKWLCLRCIYNKANVCILWWGCQLALFLYCIATVQHADCMFARLWGWDQYHSLLTSVIVRSWLSILCILLHPFIYCWNFMSVCLIFLFCSWLCWIKCIVN